MMHTGRACEEAAGHISRANNVQLLNPELRRVRPVVRFVRRSRLKGASPSFGTRSGRLGLIAALRFKDGEWLLGL
jgi:hypothetical protein